MVTIEGVRPKTRASRHFIRAGDELVSINGYEIRDVLDYNFRITSEKVELCVRRGDRIRKIRLRKPEDETDIGLDFRTYLMDDKKSCRNKCIFCFIDQNPEGMRESVYFKDDDSRLSFLHGNYITMTNLSDEEVDRIIEMHISPVNISVHTTNPELRVRMMNNRFAGESLRFLRRFADAGIRICAQIVLCRGINDGRELDRTMNDLVSYLPALDSVSVVPAGLTKHRGKLYPLSPYTPCEAAEIIRQVTEFGDTCLSKYGSRIFYAADELYVQSGTPLPGEEFYGEFSQFEDGIGMLTSFEAEADRALARISPAPEGTPVRHISVATGYAAYDELRRVCGRIEEKYGAVKISVIRIKNEFFGESVTVAGLLTGRDIAGQVKGQDLGECLLFPPRALNSEKNLFLDDMTPEQLSGIVGVPVAAAGCDGDDFVSGIIDGIYKD